MRIYLSFRHENEGVGRRRRHDLGARSGADRTTPAGDGPPGAAGPGRGQPG